MNILLTFKYRNTNQSVKSNAYLKFKEKIAICNKRSNVLLYTVGKEQ